MRNQSTSGRSPRQPPPNAFPASPAEYECWYRRSTDAGNWFIFKRHWLLVMSPAAAILAQYLLSRGAYKCRDGGWIPATQDFLRSGIGYSKKTQETALLELKRRGYIELAKLGLPATRHVRVNPHVIDRDVDASLNSDNSGGDKSTRNRVDWTTRNRVVNKTDASTKHQSNKHCRSTDSPASPAASDLGDGVGSNPMVPLLDVPNRKRDKYHPAQKDFDAARRLHEAIVSRTNVRRRWSEVKWAKEFARLRNEVGDSRLDPALDWYCNNIKKAYTPEIYCGKTFRDKLPRIEAAMLRDAKRNPFVYQVVTPEANKAARRLAVLGWPAGTDTQLPAFVQHTAESMLEFRRKLISYTNTVGVFGDKLSVALYAADKLAGGVVYDRAEDWGRETHRRVSRWPNFPGTLAVCVWSPDGKEFTGEARGWASRKCGKPGVWDQIMKEIK